MTPLALPDQLTKIAGLDPALALRHVDGHLPILARALRRFVSTYADGLPALLEPLGIEHEVVSKWRLVCHSARGSLATIGATALRDQVVDLENELRELRSRSAFIAKGRALHYAMREFAARVDEALVASNGLLTAPPAPLETLDGLRGDQAVNCSLSDRTRASTSR